MLTGITYSIQYLLKETSVFGYQYGNDFVRINLTFHDWFQQTRMRSCDW